ncbi:hypothetical protein [Nonomuraea sp. GTA35]|uniref:hypothetical protein n=1 Tax=Nonomuraea sp. GTA35 TaxID=1676746 RepID=UPI0035BF61F6
MRTSLVVERLDRMPGSVTLSPGLSMLALITDALSGRGRGAPESWRQRLRSAAGDQDEMVVRSLASPGFTVLPDVVLPGELEEITGGRPVSHWRGAIEDPRPAATGRRHADLMRFFPGEARAAILGSLHQPLTMGILARRVAPRAQDLIDLFSS